jgi:non-homologous end joining protein Ku
LDIKTNHLNNRAPSCAQTPFILPSLTGPGFSLAIGVADGYLLRVFIAVARLTISGTGLLLCCLLFQAADVRAEELSLTNLITRGDLLSQQHDARAALQLYRQAEKSFRPHDMDDTDAQQIAAKILETGKWPRVF